jgi:5-formyltetrahydrofolate cyclo-ligase
MTTRGALSVQMAKQDLRREMRERRATISPAAAADAAEDAARVALALPVWERVRTAALYVAIRDELDVAPLERGLTARGITLVIPRVHPDRRALLHFHRLDALDGPDAYVIGPMGLREPPSDAPEVPLSTIDLFVVPGLAFDPRGARLGYGRGHFDATLAAAAGALRIAYAYQIQIVPAVPESAGDERVDVIVTEAGARETYARPPEAPWRVRP